MRVLICDDEPAVRQLYRFAFEDAGAEVDEAADGEECIAMATATDVAFDLIVLDLFMPKRDGLSTLPELRACSPSSSVFIVSAHAGVEVFNQSRALGADACFEKVGFLNRIPAVLARFTSAD